jgi:hypothetical protein
MTDAVTAAIMAVAQVRNASLLMEAPFHPLHWQ